MVNANLSRLDAKIRQKQLVDSKIEDFWDFLWEAVQATSKKLNEHYNAQLTTSRNDHNTVIRVGAPFNTITHEKPSLEIRLKREERKVVARYTIRPDSSVWEQPLCFLVKARLETDDLCLVKGNVPLTPIDVVEQLLAETLLKLNLEI